MPIHDYDSAVAFLMGRINYEQAPQVPYSARQFKLRRMERLLKLLGNPHHRLPAVHIAGTKGKGSTAVMIEAILRAAGYRTGLYTSPHLERVEERFALDGAPCNEAAFVSASQFVQPAVQKMDAEAHAYNAAGPTYFEITTAIAMLLFAEAKVDAAVLEVGLGGRLDSTNVCRPRVTVITSISYDHTQQLGSTIESIAREKAGILKPGVPVICGVGRVEASQVVREVAAQRRCSVRELDVDFGIHFERRRAAAVCDGATSKFEYWEASGADRLSIPNLSLAMLGKHQSTNAALAVAAARELSQAGFSIGEAAIRRGLASAVCPARIELLSERPPVILDAAHNVASCQALAEAIDERFPNHGNRTLILATSHDKDARGMLEVLLPRFRRVILTRFENSARAADPRQLQCYAAALLEEDTSVAGTAAAPEIFLAQTPSEALQRSRITRDSDDSLLCVAGSFFLAGQMRPLLQARLPHLNAAPVAAAPD